MRTGLTLGLALLLAAAGTAAPAGAAERELRLAVDPVLQQSGLLDRLLPSFREARGVGVAVRALPSKEALELGAAGGADVVWVHAPRQEVQYLNQGFYLRRRLVLYTDHVLAGPPGDPARVKATRRLVLAFRRIAQSKAPFVSGGERSGSHVLEQELWKKAGVSPEAPWYIRAGGEAEAPVLAARRGAYVLVDRASVEALSPKGQLEVLLEGVRPLRRGYHVLEVNPHRFPQATHEDAKALGDYLLSAAAQAMIRAFGGDQAGKPAFVPAAGKRESDL